ncbi:hypothetical protein C8Q76DRAFT_693681 [Earliella scabrosa]|nr:hypothetical protein C8Q76DRAFT_693681 [Earliella scabrosa]
MASGPKESYPAALHPSESVDATTNAPTMSSSASGENARLSPYEDGAVMSLQAQPPPPSLRSLFQVPGYPQPRTKQCIHCRMASEICTGGRTCERCFLSGLRCETDDNAELQTLYIAQPRPRVIPPPPSADFPQYTYPVAPRPIPESGSFPCPADSRPLSPDRASETHVEYAATPISTPAPRYVAEAPPQEPPRSLSAVTRHRVAVWSNFGRVSPVTLMVVGWALRALTPSGSGALSRAPIWSKSRPMSRSSGRWSNPSTKIALSRVTG